MPPVDFDRQAEALRGLLAADAVLYWRRDTPALAVPLGTAPAGILGTGFLPPACAAGVHLLRGKPACALTPLRLHTRLHIDSCTVLSAADPDKGGILAVWKSSDAQPPSQAEALADFALAALVPQLDLAGACDETERSQARRLGGMADALPLGVIVVPAGNRPGYVNHMAAALLRVPHGTIEAGLLAGKLAELAQRAGNHETLAAQVEAFVAGHGSSPISGQVWRFGNPPCALRVTVAPVAPNKAEGWFWLLEDVTAAEAEAEARERQRHLEWLNADLEQRVRERTAQLEHTNEVLLHTNMELEHFAHAIAHDLQTPLRSIAGFAQLVQGAVKQYGNADVDAWSSQVINNARRLQTLIQGLLSYTRLEANAVRVEAADMNALFDEVVASLQAIIQETGAEVSRGELPAASCVRPQMGQVLQNLIENGLKYNTSKPPKVSVSCRREEDDWVFAVADNGMGIDPKYHDRIFGMFKRLHSHAEIPGSGIGLALCRRIVERHGGRLWVESRAGAGATFRFSLPVERPAG
ncbi:MAG TPA: ATP-binding protein [Rhodocyclaceae bacterium]|nr:ATP-binding protein [Rhodocyclaceae bacterium]